MKQYLRVEKPKPRFCTACEMEKLGVKSRKRLPHTCDETKTNPANLSC